MIHLMYGAVGAFSVLTLLVLGFLAGWKANEVFAAQKRPAAEEVTEEQRRHLLAQQQAFEEMLHYNQDTAYGANRILSGMGGADYE